MGIISPEPVGARHALAVLTFAMREVRFAFTSSVPWVSLADEALLNRGNSLPHQHVLMTPLTATSLPVSRAAFHRIEEYSYSP